MGQKKSTIRDTSTARNIASSGASSTNEDADPASKLIQQYPNKKKLEAYLVRLARRPPYQRKKTVFPVLDALRSIPESLVLRDADAGKYESPSKSSTLWEKHETDIENIISSFQMDDADEIFLGIRSPKDLKILSWILLSWCYKFGPETFQDVEWRREYCQRFLLAGHSETLPAASIIQSITRKHPVWQNVAEMEQHMVSYVQDLLDHADQENTFHLSNMTFLDPDPFTSSESVRSMLLRLTQRCVAYHDWNYEKRDEKGYKSRLQADYHASRRAVLVELWLKRQQEDLEASQFLKLVVDEIKEPYGRLDLAMRLFFTHIHDKDEQEVPPLLLDLCIDGLAKKIRMFLNGTLLFWFGDEIYKLPAPRGWPDRVSFRTNMVNHIISFITSYWNRFPLLCDAIIGGINEFIAKDFDISMLTRGHPWHAVTLLGIGMCSKLDSQPKEYPPQFYQSQSAQDIKLHEMEHFLAYNLRRLRFYAMSLAGGDWSHPPDFFQFGVEAPDDEDIATVSLALDEILFCLHAYKDHDYEFLEVSEDLDYAVTELIYTERRDQTRAVTALYLLLMSAARSPLRVSQRQQWESKCNYWISQLRGIAESATMRRIVLEYHRHFTDEASPFPYPGGPYYK